MRSKQDEARERVQRDLRRAVLFISEIGVELTEAVASEEAGVAQLAYWHALHKYTTDMADEIARLVKPSGGGLPDLNAFLVSKGKA